MKKQFNKTMKKQWKSLFEYYGFTEKEAKEYPVISKILKQLTPERIKKEIREVQRVKLPPELQKWVKEYEKVGERDEFIWRWTYLGMRSLTLSTVSKKFNKSVCVTKTLSIIINVLLDDIADKKQNEKMLNEALNIFFNDKKLKNHFHLFNKNDRKYLNLIKKIWHFLNKTLKKYPRYKEFKDFFEYDYRQFLNTIRYSYLINRNPYLINEAEFQFYLSHNMQGMISLTIDLMASPEFNYNKKEIIPFRKISWWAQRMGRIGNSITTWEREIKDNDFTSEIFAHAIKKGTLQPGDLEEKNQEKIIKKIKKSKTEKYLLTQWEKYFCQINKLSKKIHSIKIERFLKGLKKLIILHLISKGWK